MPEFSRKGFFSIHALLFVFLIGFVSALSLSAETGLYAETGEAPANQTLNQQVSELNREQILSQIAEMAINQHIRPRYKYLRDRAADLAEELNQFCRAPTNETLKRVRKKFNETALSFAAIEHIRFGPIAENYRMERLVYWPDRKGRGARAIRQLLQKKDPNDLGEDRFVKKSIALQGLTALEYVLYGQVHEQLLSLTTDGQFSCAYAQRIGQNILKILQRVYKSWGPTSLNVQQMLNPDQNNQRYRSHKEVIQEFYQSITGGMKVVVEGRMGGLLGRDGKSSKPKRALFWRSGLSLGIMQKNIEAIDHLIVVSGFENLLSREPVDLRNHTRKIYKDIYQSFERFKGANVTMNDVLSQPDERERFVKIKSDLGHLTAGFARHLAIAADIPMGFNASDGD